MMSWMIRKVEGAILWKKLCVNLDLKTRKKYNFQKYSLLINKCVYTVYFQIKRFQR